MKLNMGKADRAVRLTISATLIILAATEIVTGDLAIVFYIISGIMILTSLIGFCPLYLPFGIKTCSRKKALILLLPVFFIALSSCNDDTDDPTNINDTLNDGVWTVSYFYDNNKDETSDFSGYTFEFEDNNQLRIVKSGSEMFGTWSTHVSDGVTKLDISAGSNDPLEELNDDWDVIEQTDNKIRLEDQSGDGSMEYLTFTRN